MAASRSHFSASGTSSGHLPWTSAQKGKGRDSAGTSGRGNGPSSSAAAIALQLDQHVAPRQQRVIIALDIDQFYVAACRKRDPTLVGLPIGIKQKSLLATVSYEGARRASRSWRASEMPCGSARR